MENSPKQVAVVGRGEVGRGEEQGPDPFKKLPNELIVFIFDKISETKPLAAISLVSKRFHSLVYQIGNVPFKIPFLLNGGFPSNQDLISHFAEAGNQAVHIVTVPFGALLSGQASSPASASDSDALANPLTKILGKFKFMKSLHLEFDYSAIEPEQRVLVYWMVDRMSANYILTLGGNPIPDLEPVEYASLIKVQMDLHLTIASTMFELLEKVLPTLPESLLRVVFTDFKNQGRLDLGETELVKMRAFRNAKDHIDGQEITGGFWLSPGLKQPAPGNDSDFHMRTFRIEGAEGNHSVDILTLQQLFEGEDAALLQAVKEMLKKVLRIP